MGEPIAKNKKAFHDYDIKDTFEAGIVLKGDEVKSIRQHGISLVGSYATIHEGELYLINATIAAYKQAYQQDKDNLTRRRKLLVHRKELERLVGDISRKGVTLIPLSVYFNDRNKVKVSVGICKHKNAAQKKQVLKERDIRREAEREIRNR